MATTIQGIEGAKALAGQDWGTSGWVEVTQEQVNTFADATGDHQWIHVDVEKAKTGPFGGPIAHGFLTLSLIPVLFHDVVHVEGISMAVNYGLNKVRFPAPVPVGAKLRAHIKNLSVEDVQGGVQVINQITIELEGQAKPVCVAEFISRYFA
ncbi:MaoC family dehydratase [Frankia sp. CNm7]|uniref:MaoC family dehydratase n=1 Tax=Frankia nepalensis TaxID=1836974 RepID=A0A937RGH8_9ACTN|nr:MaoC family dehydratase [Frankia nepalensis]MBL7499907.1 MaoC family dehydratase [Frankia nepalensis]MBL7516005.1 MaoC family dehydratase [Frankia nepalensis]MBL7517867.1 MaoC family dehydratase [Frankia nepalensis]MBL7625631.1 MaoC family dehydratase [Frankia nepalensis]